MVAARGQEQGCEGRSGRTAGDGFALSSAPVSRPLLTLSPALTRAAEGQVVTLHCKAPRGSLPIVYQFFHEDEPLREPEAASRRGSSLRFTATAAHSGSFYCVADNGGGPQRSQPVTLSVKGEPGGCQPWPRPPTPEQRGPSPALLSSVPGPT